MNIAQFLSNSFSDNVWIIVFIISMIPTLESKIAIPLALNKTMWGASALTVFPAFIIAYLGSIIPSYFLLILSRQIKKHSSFVYVNKFMSKFSYKTSAITRQENNFKKFLKMVCFVAVPVPLTGVWSGSIIGGLSDLNINYCFISIAIGAFISAIITTILCVVFSNSVFEILIISLVVIILFLFVDLFVDILSKKKTI